MSGLLLDTHLLYWWMTADRKLGKDTEALIATAAVSVSVASQWEMILKHGKGKLPLPDGALAGAIEREAFQLMPIRAEHVDAVRGLPGGLDDPFDRLLLATAMVEGLALLTRDQAIIEFAAKLARVVVRKG